jgi:hypothetical protein
VLEAALFTSYWHKPALKHPPYDTVLKIGISRRKSRFVTYACEELDDVPFAPSEALLRWWKGCDQTPEDEAVYERTYRAALEAVGIEQVAAALREKVADHDAAILLCHEKTGRFCGGRKPVWPRSSRRRVTCQSPPMWLLTLSKTRQTRR